MPRPFSSRRADLGDLTDVIARNDEAPIREPAERLCRLAVLVAVGTAPIPADLEPQSLSIVLAEVARLRRERLIRLVARAIAQDIHNERK